VRFTEASHVRIERDLGSPAMTWVALLGAACAWIFGGALVGAIVTLAVVVLYGALFVGESVLAAARIASRQPAEEDDDEEP
jgi:hypothetical protein